MKDLVQGIIGAIIVSLLPVMISYMMWRLDRKAKRNRNEWIFHTLENHLLDIFNKGGKK